MAGSTTLDIALASGMLILLYDCDQDFRKQAHCNFPLFLSPFLIHLRRASNRVHRLTVVIVNTGLLTAILAVVSLILVGTSSSELPSGPAWYLTLFKDIESIKSKQLWNVTFLYLTCPAYIAGLLANLNSRHYIRGEGGLIIISNIEDVLLEGGFSAHPRLDLDQLRPPGWPFAQSRREASTRTNSDATNVNVSLLHVYLIIYCS